MEKRQRIAAYGLLIESGRILLCRLSKKVPRWEGSWTLPGGGIEFGESPEDAMIREVEEETGLRVSPRKIVHVSSIHDQRYGLDFHGVRIIYEVEKIGGKLRSELDGTTDLCAWHQLPVSEDTKLVDLSEEVIDVVLNMKAEPVAGANATR